MAVHCVRVFVEPPKGDAEQAIQNWVSNYSEWTEDPVEHGLTEANTELDGSGTQYLSGDWRFLDQGEDPTNILDDLSQRLQNIQGGLWHRLGYHVCTHDEQDPSSCSWEQSVESGSVPQGVPAF